MQAIIRHLKSKVVYETFVLLWKPTAIFLKKFIYEIRAPQRASKDVRSECLRSTHPVCGPLFKWRCLWNLCPPLKTHCDISEEIYIRNARASTSSKSRSLRMSQQYPLGLWPSFQVTLSMKPLSFSGNPLRYFWWNSFPNCACLNEQQKPFVQNVSAVPTRFVVLPSIYASKMFIELHRVNGASRNWFVIPTSCDPLGFGVQQLHNNCDSPLLPHDVLWMFIVEGDPVTRIEMTGLQVNYPGELHAFKCVTIEVTNDQPLEQNLDSSLMTKF